MARRKVDEEMMETIRELNEAGLTVPRISKEMNLSSPTLYKYLEIMQLQPNGRKQSNVDHVGMIAAYEDLNRTVGSVLDEYEISTTAMYAILKRNNVKPRLHNPKIMEAKQAQMDHALDMYQNSDRTIISICVETGISQPKLHQEIRERKIPFRNPKMASPVYDKEGEEVKEKWDN